MWSLSSRNGNRSTSGNSALTLTFWPPENPGTLSDIKDYPGVPFSEGKMYVIRCLQCSESATAAPEADIVKFHCRTCDKVTCRQIPRVPSYKLMPLHPSERPLPKG